MHPQFSLLKLMFHMARVAHSGPLEPVQVDRALLSHGMGHLQGAGSGILYTLWLYSILFSV